MSIEEYLEWYVLYIPHEVYWWGGGVFLILLLVLTVWKGWRGARWALTFLLMEYVALLMYFTVFCRRATGIYEWRLIPLWSYRAIGQGINVLMEEVAMNVAVFVPIGFLLGVILRGWPWWKVMIPGICVSIEKHMGQVPVSNVMYLDKVRLNCYYYRHYSFIKDIEMILCTVLGRHMEYAGEVI